MPTAAEYLNRTMQLSAHAHAAALKRGVRMDQISLHCIDYAHRFEFSFVHVTLSDFDGRPLLTCSFDSQLGRQERTTEVTADDLSGIWNGLVDLPVFARHHVADGGTEVDPINFHVVGFSSLEGALPAMGLFLIPDAETDPDWTRWLGQLKLPKSPQ